jgi:hypothetical protein
MAQGSLLRGCTPDDDASLQHGQQIAETSPAFVSTMMFTLLNNYDQN